MTPIPEKLPITYGDRALYGSGRTYCQMVHGDLRFAEKIDPERLVRAAGAVCRTYPVLAGRSDPARDRFWRIDPDFARKPRLCVERVDADGGDGAPETIVSQWLNRNIDVRTEFPLRLVLVRAPTRDRLLLSMHHSVGDGRSFLLVLQALHRFYNADPASEPSPDFTPRDLPFLLSHYPGGWWGTYLKALPVGLSRELRRPRSDGWVPWRGGPAAPVRRYTRIELTEAQTRRIKEAAKRAGRTVNDVMLAANGLAWREMRHARGLPAANYTIGMLVDMRRGEAAKVQTVANLSSVEILEVGRERVESDGFAEAIMDAAAERKAHLPGVTAISPLLAIQALTPHRWLVPRLQRFWDRGVANSGLSSWLTNVGPLPDVGEWGGVRLERAHVLVAAMDPPIIMGSVATFEGKCTVIFGFADEYLSAEEEAELQDSFRRGCDAVAEKLEKTTPPHPITHRAVQK